MRRFSAIIFLLCTFALAMSAQHIQRNYHNRSMSDVLIDLDKASKRYKISFIYNELHSETLVMSYRGQKGAIEAANRGNYAVMTPGEVLYFDWYQADPHTQPRAMGGFSPIRKMYGFHPVPDTPAKAADNDTVSNTLINILFFI